MSKEALKQDEELSFVDLIFFIYENKFVIISSLLISFLIGFTYLQTLNKLYTSKIFFSINVEPPIFGNFKSEYLNRRKHRQIDQDFKNLFFSKAKFNEWKLNTNSPIDFLEFNRLIKKDNVFFSKSEKNLDLIFKYEKAKNISK